jgi:hypothetical protein
MSLFRHFGLNSCNQATWATLRSYRLYNRRLGQPTRSKTSAKSLLEVWHENEEKAEGQKIETVALE